MQFMQRAKPRLEANYTSSRSRVFANPDNFQEHHQLSNPHCSRPDPDRRRAEWLRKHCSNRSFPPLADVSSVLDRNFSTCLDQGINSRLDFRVKLRFQLFGVYFNDERISC